MAKIWSFTIMFLTMIIFLEFIGIPTGVSSTLNTFGITINNAASVPITADFENASFWGEIFVGSGILVSLGAGVVIVGLFTRTYDASLVVIPLIVTMAGLFISTIVSVMTIVSALNEAWLTKIIGIIFIGLGAAFIGACVDYFRSGQ